jgi:ferredoxin-NADP reductase
MLAEVAWPAADGPLACVCGRASFAGSVAASLVALGYPAERVSTERSGATGQCGEASPLDDNAQDGDAIGGLLIEVFGAGMTAATGTCGSRGSVSRVAELACACPGAVPWSAAAPARPC